MSEATTRPPRRDSGFTLVELLIVIVIIGVITVSLSNSVITVLRTNVVVTKTLDDASDLLYLPVWLPQDVNSTPRSSIPGTGIETGDLPSQCSGTDPGVGLLRLTWTEQTSATNTMAYRVSYRAITSGGTTRVQRVFCEDFGAPRMAAVTRDLPTFPDGSAPIAVTATTGKVIFEVTQHPGTTSQRTIKIEAVSKNPAVPTIAPAPPPPPDPVLTVPASANAGSSITASAAGFTPGDSIGFYIDITSSTVPVRLASATAGSSGTATATFTVPLNIVRGTHTVYAMDDDGFASAEMFVNNATLTVTNGANVAPGDDVQLSLNGFTIGDSIAFEMDGSPIGEPTSYGSANQSVTIPIPITSVGGEHEITATAGSGRRAVTDPRVNVIGTLIVDPSSAALGSPMTARVHGFKAFESVTLRLDSPTGPALTGSISTDVNGTATGLTFTLPTAGSHVVHADGGDVSQASANVEATVDAAGFVVTSARNVTAGSTLDLTIVATIGGVQDTSFTGPKTIAISGPGSAPNGTAPTLPNSATFTDGVATVRVTVVKAETTSFTVTHSTTTGSSAAITVSPATASAVAFSAACPGPIRGQSWTSGVRVTDALGNPINGVTVSLSLSRAAGTNSSIATFSADAWTAGAGGTSFTSTTQSGTTPTFTATGPNGNNSRPSVTVTATAAGRTASCTVTT